MVVELRVIGGTEMQGSNELTIAYATFANRLDRKPRPRKLPWGNLAHHLMQHTERAEKDGPLWSPTIYKDGATRGNAAVESVTAAVGDFDSGISWEEVELRLDRWEYVMHTTHSHTPEKPKFRVVIPFTKPVPRAKWPDIKARIDEHVFGLATDPAAKDAARIYYMPSCPPKAEKLSFYHKGQILNPFMLPEATQRVATIEGGDDSSRPAKVPLGKNALDFVANGSPLGQQRMRALAAARNYLSAGYSVNETAAAVWRGLQASPQDPERGPWTEKDAFDMVSDLAEKEAPPFPDAPDKIPPRMEMERAGLGYRCVFPTGGIVVTVDAIRRSSEGLTAELFVECNLPLLPEQLHWGRLNLASTSARGTLIRYLDKRTEGHSIPWQGMIEDLCRSVAVLERAGEPVRRIGRLPLADRFTWLVRDFVPAGETMTIYGEGQTGKSYMALAIAYSVFTGLTIVPGFVPQEQGEILYWDWEVRDVRIDQRIKAICAGMGIPDDEIPEPLYLPGRGPLVDNVEEALRICQKHGVKLIVVDSMEMAMAGTQGSGSNPNDPVIRLHSALRYLSLPVIIVDHISKEAIKGTGKRDPIGGIFKQNLSRFSFELRKSPTPNPDGSINMALYNTKRNDDGPNLKPIGVKVEFHPGELWCKYHRDDITTADLIDAMTMADKLKVALRRGERHEKDLAIAVGSTAGSVRSTMQRRPQRFLHHGKGVWSLVRLPEREAPPESPDEPEEEDNERMF